MLAGKPVGTIFAELNLDATKAERALAKLHDSMIRGTIKVEDAYKSLGIKSDQMYEMQKRTAMAAVDFIKNKTVSSKEEILRAEKAAAAKIAALDEEMYGKRLSMLDKLKANWLAATAAIAAAYMALRKAWDLASQAAEFEQSRQAFRSMAQSMGADAEEVFGRVRELSGGLIDDAALTRSMNKALSLGIPIEKLGDLMSVARAKSRDMGITATQAFEDIATGIGRASPLILDNLGLALKLGAANEAMAASLGKTVEQLTDKEKKTAILNATLEAGKESLSRYNLETKTTAEQMQALEVQVKNIGTTIGGFIIRLGTGLMGVFNTLAAAATSIVAAIMAIPAAVAKATDYLGITKGRAGMFVEYIDALAESSEDLLKKAEGNFKLAVSGASGVGAAPALRGAGSAGAGAGVGAADSAKKKATDSYLDTLNKQRAYYEAFDREIADIILKGAADEEKVRLENEKRILDAQKAGAEESAKAYEEAWASVDLGSLQSVYENAIGRGDALTAIGALNDGLAEQIRLTEEAQNAASAYTDVWIEAHKSIGDMAINVGMGIRDNMISALTDVITGARSLGEAFAALGKSILTMLVETLVRWVVNKTIMAALEKAYQTAAVAAATASGAAIAAAYAPAAAMVSLATFGGNSAPAMAGIVSTVALAQALAVPALAEGGIVNRPTVALIGEKGPEAIVPLDKADVGGVTQLILDGQVLAEWYHRAVRQGVIQVVPA